MTDVEKQAQEKPGFTWLITEGGKEKKPVVPEGIYLAHLVSIVSGTQKKYENPDEREPAFFWNFMLYPDVNDESKCREIQRRCKQSTNEKSMHYRMIKACNGHSLPKEAFKLDKNGKPEVYKGSKSLTIGYATSLMNDLVGKWYLVPIIVSEDGQWNNIGDLDEIKQAQAPDKRANDDIPF